LKGEKVEAYLKDLFARWLAAKIIQIKEFTPAEWAATTAP
jgi:acid stress-induced BolA-like protein IbaG/YrbA